MNGHTGRVCVVGSFMMDLTLRVPRRPAPGETVVGTSFDMFLGGKGFNQALAAARTGAPTAMIGRLGADDFGQRFRTCLAADGIDDTHVGTDPTEGTGIGVPLVDDSGENSIVIVSRANRLVSVDDVDRARALIASSAVVMLQMEVPSATLVAAARMAKAAGVTVILNPAPAVDTVERFNGLIDVIVPNHGEALRLIGDSPSPTGAVDDGTDPRHAATLLREQTGAAVVITLGAHGALVLDDEGPARLVAHEVPVVDTVGAGDVFCGALGAGLADGAPLRTAAAYANAAAAIAVTRRGAEPSIPTRRQVLELLDPKSVVAIEPVALNKS